MMRLLAAPIAVVMILLSSATSALAGHFSSAIRLPTTRHYWEFAIDRGGSAGGLEGTDTGALLYSLGRGTRLSDPTPLSVPGGFSLFDGNEDIAFGPDHRVVAGLSYTDDTAPAGEEEHGAPACCGRAAVAAWRLGGPPPPTQTLTPKFDADIGFRESPGEPAVVAGRSAVTALWSVGGNGEPPEPGPAKLKEGFGAFGGPLHVQLLAHARNGIDEYVLTKTRRGTPIAAWLEDGDRLHVVTGTAGGAMHHSRRAQTVRLLRDDASEQGFVADGLGDIVFWYLVQISPGQSDLLMRTSTGGGAFTAPHLIARLPSGEGKATVQAGANRSILAEWEWTDKHDHMHLQAALGGVRRRFVRSRVLPAGLFGVAATGFVGRGEAYVMFRQSLHGYGAEESPKFRLKLMRAREGYSFENARPFVPRLRNCGINTAGETVYSGEEVIPTSPDGAAILKLACGRGAEYIVRYTP